MRLSKYIKLVTSYSNIVYTSYKSIRCYNLTKVISIGFSIEKAVCFSCSLNAKVE